MPPALDSRSPVANEPHPRAQPCGPSRSRRAQGDRSRLGGDASGGPIPFAGGERRTGRPRDHDRARRVDPPTVAGTVPSSELAADAAVLGLAQGPCLTSSLTNQTIVVHNTATDARWHHWAAHAAVAGVGSVLSMPLAVPCVAGSLNLWSPTVRYFDAADFSRAAHLAALASEVLNDALRTRHLERAVDSRSVIGQTQGILIERHRMTPAAAFSVLTACCQPTNRKIKTPSEGLVTTGQFPHHAIPTPVDTTTA